MTAAAIAAGDPHTAEAGAEVLRAGGNAVDAICAASCMAFVAEAPLCGPGGGGVLLSGRPTDLHVLDFFAVVPGRGRPAGASVDFAHVDVDFGPTTQRFHIGRGSVAVPTTLLGLLHAHRRYGKMPWVELVKPAVAAARRGVVASEQLAFIVELLRPILTIDRDTEALFFDDAGTPSFSNPKLADALEAMARDGESFVRGAICRDLVAEFGAEQGGLLTSEDLDSYEPVWRSPLRTTLGGAEVFTNPPPSSGGSLVALGLRLAAEQSLASLPWLGPAHATALVGLLAAIDRAKAASVPAALGSTTHISVLDRDGQLASLTMSNGEGCGHTLGAYGMHLNNFLGEEDINPGGFHQQAPGTRMTTMMAPTAVVADGRVALVLGTGGSNRIRSALLLTVLYALESGRSLAEAVAAPRMHVEGERLWYERPGLPAEAEAALRKRWPEAIAFEERNMFFGGVHAVEGGPHVRGVGDARRGGAVVCV